MTLDPHEENAHVGLFFVREGGEWGWYHGPVTPMRKMQMEVYFRPGRWESYNGQKAFLYPNLLCSEPSQPWRPLWKNLWVHCTPRRMSHQRSQPAANRSWRQRQEITWTRRRIHPPDVWGGGTRQESCQVYSLLLFSQKSLWTKHITKNEQISINI